jgi:hypothetical protein
LLTVLQVQPLDPVEVLACEGAPVPAGVPVLLVHCMTLAPLAVDAGVLELGQKVDAISG